MDHRTSSGAAALAWILSVKKEEQAWLTGRSSVASSGRPEREEARRGNRTASTEAGDAPTLVMAWFRACAAELPDRDSGNRDVNEREDHEGHGVRGSVTRAEKERHEEEGESE